MTDTEGENGFNGWKAECQSLKMSEHEYVRLNVEGKLHEVRLDEWRPSDSGTETVRRIMIETQGYLEQPRVQEYINSVAAQVVNIRRQRAATERWESFATDVQYQCNVCKEQKPRPGDRSSLRSHILAKHNNISLHKDLDRPKREKFWARLRKSRKDKALDVKEPKEKKSRSRLGRHKDHKTPTASQLSENEVEVVLNKSRIRKGVNFNGVQG